jgi:spermidine dehydrogenase
MLRRDFLNGALLGAGMPWLGAAHAQTPYPPGLAGLRGSHPGSMDLAHERAWSGATDVPAPETTAQYDLVVVGAGISGLATAYYYQRALRKDARILILDNHDDFGGHARRNEFTVQGRRILSYGGTQSLDTPENYSAVAMGLMRELGVDLVTLRRAYDLDYFRRHRLGLGMFYDADTFGRDVLLSSSLPPEPPSFYARHYVPGIGVPPAFARPCQAPLSPVQRAQLGL